MDQVMRFYRRLVCFKSLNIATVLSEELDVLFVKEVFVQLWGFATEDIKLDGLDVNFRNVVLVVFLQGVESSEAKIVIFSFQLPSLLCAVVPAILVPDGGVNHVSILCIGYSDPDVQRLWAVHFEIAEIVL